MPRTQLKPVKTLRTEITSKVNASKERLDAAVARHEGIVAKSKAEIANAILALMEQKEVEIAIPEDGYYPFTTFNDDGAILEITEVHSDGAIFAQYANANDFRLHPGTYFDLETLSVENLLEIYATMKPGHFEEKE